MAVLNKENESNYNQDSPKDSKADEEKTPLRQRLESWLNKNMRIEMTDGRVLVGIFLCTDRDRNVILGSCAEYVVNEEVVEEPRVLGLAMVPGHHIVSIEIDNELATNTDVL